MPRFKSALKILDNDLDNGGEQSFARPGRSGGLTVPKYISYGKSWIEMGVGISLGSLHPWRTLTAPCCFVLCFRQAPQSLGSFQLTGSLVFLMENGAILFCFSLLNLSNLFPLKLSINSQLVGCSYFYCSVNSNLSFFSCCWFPMTI